MITSEQLQEIMANYYCTECYHRFDLFGKGILLTDGVKAFIENANTFWFVNDFLIFMNKWINKNPEETFYSVKLRVKNGKATVEIKDGEDKRVYTKRYAYTDCPEGNWLFFYSKYERILLWHGEY